MGRSCEGTFLSRLGLGLPLGVVGTGEVGAEAGLTAVLQMHSPDLCSLIFQLPKGLELFRNLELVTVVLLAALHIAPALAGGVLARQLVGDGDGLLCHDRDVRAGPIHALLLDAALLLAASFQTCRWVLLPTRDVVAEIRRAILGRAACLRGGAHAGVEVFARFPLARR